MAVIPIKTILALIGGAAVGGICMALIEIIFGIQFPVFFPPVAGVIGALIALKVVRKRSLQG